jgi:hypothetical protein
VFDRHDPPVNDDELNRFWNDLVAGRRPAGEYDLSADDVQLLSDFHVRGTSSPSGAARERARRGVKVRIKTDRVERENVMSATTANPAAFAGRSVNGRAAPSRWAPPRTGAASRPRRGASGLARFASAAVLLLIVVGGYRAFEPFGSGTGQPSSIPAAFAPAGTPEAAASPTATPFPRANHPFIGVWYWTVDSDPNCCGPAIADADGTYVVYDSFSGVGIGTWRATGPRTAELSFTSQHVIPRDLFDPTQVAAGTVFQPEILTWRITITVDETGNTARFVGGGDALDSDGKVVHANPDGLDWRGTRMVRDPASVTPTPTP